MKKMFHVVLVLFSCALLAGCVTTAYAKDQDIHVRAKQQTEKIIASCKEKSQENWDSGVSSRMIQGSYDYVDCLSRKIKQLSSAFFINEGDRQDFLKQLQTYTESSYELYSRLHGGACSPCGTMFNGMHINSTAGALEDVLDRMVFYTYYHDRPIGEKNP